MKENKVEVKSKRSIVGQIVSDKMDKTRIVLITEVRRHPIYGKTYKYSHKIKAHDEENTFKTGDEVEIEETRPISRDKAWRIIRKIK